MNIVGIISLILFFWLVLVPVWILGIIRTFLYVDDKFSHSNSKIMSFLASWISSLVLGITFTAIAVGVAEIHRQWEHYKARKNMTAEQIEASGNMSIWAEARKNDRIKLIYTYVLAPIGLYFSLSGEICSELYRKYGYEAAMNIPFRTLFILCIIGYLPIALPPILIRFVIIRRRLKYGLEVSIYLVLSLFISLLSYYSLIGNIPVAFGLLDTLAIYCILSYKSSEYSEEWHSLKFNPIGFALIALAVISGIVTNGKQYHLPIWEAIVACCVLTRYKNKATQSEPEQLQDNTQEPPCQDGGQEPINLSIKLIDIGLAHIGRKTSLSNKYLTPEQTEARKSIERPFLKILAEKFRDEAVRKKLTRHFMLYKETTLFMIYAIVLKNNKELHSQVRSGMKKILSLNMSSEVQDKRWKYWQEISRKFYDEYKRTGNNIKAALNFSFWSKLLDEVPEMLAGESYTDMRTEDGLYAVFMYSYGAISREYKALINS